MKIIGFPVLLMVLLVPRNLPAQELYSIRLDREHRDSEIVLGEYRDGAWLELAFPPAGWFDGNFSPALAVSPGGELWTVWAARRSGDKPKIYFSRKQGGDWTEPRRVTAGEESWEMTPAIAFGPEGALLAAWAGELDDRSGIYSARWEGDAFGPAVPVSSPGFSPALHPALAVDTGGRSLLVWQGWDGDYYRLFYSFFDGRQWTEEQMLAPPDATDQFLPSVSSLGGSGWQCFWVERGKLLSVNGGLRGWSEPISQNILPARVRAGAGEPAGAGWVVEKDREGRIRTRRTGILFDPGADAPDRRERSGIGNRVFIGYGDSITKGYPGEENSYIPYLESILRRNHGESYTIYNEGYGGINTSQLLSGGYRPGKWNCPGISGVVDRYNASHILIMAGTNDYDQGYSQATTKSHLRGMIDRARNRGCEPVLATIIPCYRDYPARYNWHEVLNSNYIYPLARHNCLFANPWQSYVGRSDGGRSLLHDQTHPNRDGAQVIAGAWFAAFPDPAPSPSTEPSPSPSPEPTPYPLLSLIDSGDYNGDGTSEIGIFRNTSGLWAIRGVTRTYFGREGDIPAAGDFTGDGTTDIALFRKISGLWVIRGLTRVYFGGDGDIPAPGDYNGDGTVAPAVFRPANGLWAVRGGTRTYFGSEGDIPVPFYPDGRDNPKQFAVFRPTTGLWASPGRERIYFGRPGDRPVIGIYGPSASEPSPALFRSECGLWAVRGVTRTYFGRAEDEPIPGNYTGFRPDDIGIFRPTNGLWAVRRVTRAYFGTLGDIPVSGFSINPSSNAML